MNPQTIPAASNPALVASNMFSTWTLQRGAGIEGLGVWARRMRAPVGNEVRVRMRAVGLNHRDLMFANGPAGAATRPIVPASDGAGEVLEVGPLVSSLRVGDRVISSFFPDWLAGPPSAATTDRALGGSMDGVLIEEAILPEGAWVPMPAHFDFDEAATLGCAAVTAWHALFCLEPLPPGATVAVLGSGGVSTWALQLAKAAGYRVIATSSEEHKLARLRALGADATVNYRLTPEWGQEIRRLTQGEGVHRVIDVGGPDTIEQSLVALRTGGSVAVVGRLSGIAPAKFDPALLFGGAKRLFGVLVGSRAMTQDLAHFVEQAQLRPVIDRVFDFAKAREAYAYLASGRHIGKVVISVGDS